MNRRDFIRLTGASALSATLPGCCLIDNRSPTCLFEKHIPNTSGLIIDSHAHIFNGTDLQIKEFIGRVQGRKFVDWAWLRHFFGFILEKINWALAPSAKEELLKLRLADSCKNIQESSDYLDTLRQATFKAARTQIEFAVSNVPSRFEHRINTSIRGTGLRDSIGERYEDLQNEKLDGKYIISSKSDISYRQLWRFIVEMFQYRFVSLDNYLNNYNIDAPRIDLSVCHLVDYDWFLAKGRPTHSSIPQQLNVMSDLSKRSRGLAHSFVPYCPLRHLIWKRAQKHGLQDLKKGQFPPMETINKALTEQGAIGVKMYPPMGYSLSNNKSIQKDHPKLWSSKSYLPEICKESNFGEMLDECLDEFYDYCIKEDVPIMAHSAPSNLADDSFKVVFDKQYWSPLLNDKQGLKLNFGHFGGFGWADNGKHDPIADDITKAILNSADGHNKFAGMGFFASALQTPTLLKTKIKELLSHHPEMKEKLLYGTDWKMLITERRNNLYLDRVDAILTDLDPTLRLRNDSLGNNAVSFLGLAKGNKNRKRLETFYQTSDAPHWFDKL